MPPLPVIVSKRPKKLLKGLLVLADIPFTKTHDLQLLGTLAAPACPGHESLFQSTYLLTSWAFEFRYPGPGGDLPGDPDEDEIRQAMALIARLEGYLRSRMSG